MSGVKTTIQGGVTAVFKPWPAPTYAVMKNQNGEAGTSAHVSALAPATLDALAAQLLADLYVKAGKKNPWTTRQ